MTNITSYSLLDRLKELSSYSGIAVVFMTTVLPQLVTPGQLIHLLTPIGAVIGALLFFLPENRAVITAEHVFAAINKMMPAAYRVPLPVDPTAAGATAVPIIGSPGSVVAAAAKAAFLLAILVGFSMVLTACGTNVAGVSIPAAPTSPSQALYEVEAGWDLAIKQATVYAELPRCGTGAPAICSNAATVVLLYQDALKGTQALGVAKLALQGYQAIASPTASDTQKVSAAIQAAQDLLTPVTSLLQTLKVS